MDVLEKYHQEFNSIQTNWKYTTYIYTNLSIFKQFNWFI